jgi:parvulin-like peptidyl-prolyl isomerase
MLQQMREMKMFVFWFVAITFLVGFVFFSDLNFGQIRSQDADVICVVNGEKVRADVYNRYVTQLAEMERQRFQRDELTAADYDRIESQAWDGLLADMLVRQEATRLGIRAGDEEIVTTLTANPPAWVRQRFTDQQGQFDAAAFQSAVNDPAYNWGPDEQYLRFALPSLKLEKMVRAGATVSEQDVRREFARRTQRTKVRYVGVPLSSIDLGTWAPSDADVQGFYEQHPERFTRGETVTLEVLQVAKKPSPADEADALDDARQVLADEKRGESFASLVDVYSEDLATAGRGGELGWVTPQSLPASVRDAAAALAPGQTTEPIRDERGLVLLHADSVRTGAQGRELKLRQIVLIPKLSGETLDSLRTRFFEVAETAKSDFAGAATALGTTIERLEPVENFGFLPNIGFAKRLVDWAFTAQPGDVSDPVGTDSALLVARLVEKSPKGPRPLDQVRDQARYGAMEQERKRRAQEQLGRVVAAVRSGTPLDQAARAAGLTVMDPAPFAFYESVPGVGSANEFSAVAAALEPGATSDVVETPTGVYLLQAISRDPFDEAAFQNERANQYQSLLSRRETEVYEAWLKELRERAKIEDHRRPRV